MVIFSPTGELMNNLASDPINTIKPYRKYFPSDYTLYQLGYDRNMPPDCTTDQIAEDFAQVISKYIGPSIIAGISYGGFIAIPFAARHPELTKGLLLLSTAHIASDSGAAFSSHMIQLGLDGKFYEMYQFSNTAIRNPIFRLGAKIMIKKKWKKLQDTMNPFSTFINAFSHLAQTLNDRKPYLSKIKSPTLVLGGTRDIYFSEENYQETASLIPHAELVLLPGGGHMDVIEHPMRAIRIIHSYLHKIDP